jgi:GMP synthase-like glutamine amidotransferase
VGQAQGQISPMTNTTKPRLLYISMMGTPDIYNPDDYADLPDTGDDCLWVSCRLREWGVLDGLTYESVCITRGDKLPEPEGVDAVIVGGSYHSVNENQPWQEDLKVWLGQWREAGKPALGICGGHQIMCQMQGETVARRPGGVKAASATVDLTEEGSRHPLFSGFEERPSFHFGNSEHVLEAPDGSVILAHDDESKVLALDHGQNWLSVQFHPEITHDVMMRGSLIENTPEDVSNFRPLPQSSRMLVNFVNIAGLL